MTLGRLDRLDLALGGAVVVGVIGTFAVLAIQHFHGHVVAPAADLTVDAIALVVTAAVAALSWIRYRERRQPMAHAQAAAFLALAIADGFALAVSLTGDFRSVPVPVEMSQDALFVWTAAASSRRPYSLSEACSHFAAEDRTTRCCMCSESAPSCCS